jgi:hypothetical protein
VISQPPLQLLPGTVVAGVRPLAQFGEPVISGEPEGQPAPGIVVPGIGPLAELTDPVMRH